MAGDWIKMKCDLVSEREVIVVSESLELDPDTVVGKLHRLWSWADGHTMDGVAEGIKASWIDKFLACPGMSDALVRVGWLKFDDDSVIIPNFSRHNGLSAKQRCDSAIRKSASRVRAVTNVAPTCDKTATREKKKREETANKSAPTEPALPIQPPASVVCESFEPEVKPKKEREPDPIWDAVCELWGLSPVTSADKTRVGRVVRDLKLKGATLDEIRARRQRYESAWPSAECSPEALCKHWDRFSAERAERAGNVQRGPARISAPEGKYAGVGKKYTPECGAAEDLPSWDECGALFDADPCGEST